MLPTATSLELATGQGPLRDWSLMKATLTDSSSPPIWFFFAFLPKNALLPPPDIRRSVLRKPISS